MAINPFIKVLFLPVTASLQKRLIIIIPHLFGLVMVVSIYVFPLWLKFALCLLIIASYYYHFLHILLKLKKSVVIVEQDTSKNWSVSLFNNDHENIKIRVTLLPSSYISKLFIVLNFVDINGSHYSVLMTPDSISRINYKHLYIRLKSTYIK